MDAVSCGKLAGPIPLGTVSPCLSTWHDKHVFIKQLLFPSTCELYSLPLKPETPTALSLAQDGI